MKKTNEKRWKMKYGEWLTVWLEDYVRPVEKERTYNNYRDIIRLRLQPNFGETEINALDVSEIQRYITGLSVNGNLRTGKPLAANSIRLIFSVFRNSLRRACNLGYAEKYIGDKLELPKAPPEEVVCFTEAEQNRIEEEIGKMLEKRANRHKLNGIVICLHTGLRIGELLALGWKDIDFDNALMTVSKTCRDGKDENGNYKKIIDSPKTYSSRRVIPIPSGLLALLTGMKKESKSTFVISDKDGNTVKVRSFQRSFELLLKRLGIPHKKFHALRHTFATRANERAMDDKTLSEVLGHKSPVITLKLYVHSLLEHKRKMMEQVND